ncbi:fatty acid oxidation complex subunit alpha [Spirochaetota bacterium]|nr:fatty acid oxidation complex subunit alpha [Spirochaetota bacterium]
MKRSSTPNTTTSSRMKQQPSSTPSRSKNLSKGRKINKTINETIGDFKIEYNPTTNIGALTLDLKNSKVNILTSKVLYQLDQHLKKLATLPIKILLIKSAKPKSFIAGADINEIKQILKSPTHTKIIAQGQNIIDNIAHFKAPTVAVIDGHALGGGLELALACTYRIVSSESYTKLALPEVTLGILPGFGGTQRLPALIGLNAALKMILKGTAVNGSKAYRLGLADKVIPSAYISFELPKFIDQVNRNPHSLRKDRSRRLRRHFPWIVALATKLALKPILRFTRKQLLKSIGPHYPAPNKVLKIISQTYPAVTTEKIKHGLALERIGFLELLKTASTSHLLALFHHSTMLKNKAIVKAAPLNQKSSTSHLKRTLKKSHFPIEQSLVIGGGTMGAGIAWLMSHHNLPVRIKEVSWEAASSGYQKLLAIHNQRERKVGQPQQVTTAELSRTSFTTSWTPVHNETLVIEAVPENLELKKNILKTLERYCSQDTIIATNTSSLSIDQLARSLKHSERFLAIHFFNPVHRMKLVELAPGPKTDPELFATVGRFLKKQNRIVIPVKACPGFLVNRILFAYLNEAMKILEETKDIETIDASLKDFGMPMGPFRLIDQIGLDVCAHVAQCLSKAYRHLPNPLKAYKKLNQRNWLGQKAGTGFYAYASGQPMGVNPELYHELYGESALMKRTFTSEKIIERLIMAMAHESLIALELGIVQTPWELDLALLYGTGFPAFRGGILRYIDTLTPAKAFKKFERLKDFYGDHFTPPAILKDTVSRNQLFYND